jgi:hydrogenase maturation protein HypF
VRLLGLPLFPVQHHHAHLAACLADNAHPGPALGVIWDGTGYGSDGTVWGGELLVGGAATFERIGHLLPFRLPGGEAAAREPRRAALGLLWEVYGEATGDQEDLAPVRALSGPERQVLLSMLERGVHCPVTTSAGRLFDGVAALLDLHQRCSFEGQAAMALEFACDESVEDAYPIDVSGGSAAPGRPPWVVDWTPLVEAVVQDVRKVVAPAVIAARFHNALVRAIVQVARAVAEPTVVLSGGCFQNRVLLERSASALREAGFAVLLHRQVPPNDGGIALGQLAVAAARLR